MEVLPLAAHVGAEVTGVDLADQLDSEVIEQIRAALLQWKVVVFRHQHLDPEAHVAFAGRFGKVTPAHPIYAALGQHPDIWEITGIGRMDDQRPETLVENSWHTDVTYAPNPPAFSVLRAVDVPAYGGDTQWANSVTAYEKLSAPLRQFIDGLWAVHREALQLELSDLSPSAEAGAASLPRSALHPVVRVHPETGERCIFVNRRFTKHVDGLTHRESVHLLNLLHEHMTRPDFTVRVRWNPNDVVMWDNRCTTHIEPIDHFDLPIRRVMHRVTIAGTAPVGVGGSESRALVGAEFG